MLDLLPSRPEGSNSQRHMDLSQYLLSASPPASEFSLMGYSSSYSHNHIGLQELGPTSGSLNTNCPFHQSLSYVHSDSNDNFSITNINNLNRHNNTLKSIIMKSDVDPVSVDVSTEDHDNLSTSSCSQSPGRAPKKKVSFADYKGYSLTEVRLVQESPDEPPQLSCNILSSLTLGANADVTSMPPIELCFAQPASDYLAFRDKIQNNLVSLENVILRDYTVEGTIKVKNISFEKRVFVRLSLDEWVTFENFEAVYVPGLGAGSIDPYDTFSFKMEISPSFDVAKKVQFAVCFQENGREHWDNNDGKNYCIVSQDHNCLLQDGGPSYNERWLPVKRTDSWSEFSVWRDMDSAGPYY